LLLFALTTSADLGPMDHTSPRCQTGSDPLRALVPAKSRLGPDSTGDARL